MYLIYAIGKIDVNAMSDPYTIDFAALRTLRLVHEKGSFTAAAEVLGTNQSAVSYTIDKLRRALGDPLFVRQGGGIAATDRCTAIIGSTVRLLDEFETLAAPPEFDPARARQTVTIACNYYERVLIAPFVLRRLRTEAPGIRVELINSSAQGRLQLKRAEADILIGPLRPEEEGFYCRNLLDDRYACIADPANPLADAPLTLDAYANARHAVVTYGGTWKSGYLQELEAQRIDLNPVLRLPSPAGIETIVAGTDIVSTIPRRLAATMGASVRILDCPCPAPFEIDLVWTTRTHASPMHVWLRDLIAREVRRIHPD